VGNLMEKDHFEDLGVDGWNYIEMYLKATGLEGVK
jgi:hypothetical protein